MLRKKLLLIILLIVGCVFESEEEVEEFTVWRCGIVEEQPNTPAKCIDPFEGVGCEMCQNPRDFWSAEEIEANPLLWAIPIRPLYPSKEVCEENCLDLFFETEYNFDTNSVDTLATYPMGCFGYADTTCVRVDD